ncbi:prepilin-type N-terminal cleavage/methylation domain-containing protein [candidate division WOR-3 bacterium]|nr:prepilin-type N-terminal cleavage/methylation domain-containing protein [candidate division WOR-3 bacterium]
MGIYKDKGFTLIEVIVSLTILSIILLSFYQFFIASRRHSSLICKKEVALLLAERKTEHLIAGIEPEDDTVTIDTLDRIVYHTILKINEEIPPVCSVTVYANEKKVIEMQFLKP